MKKHIAACELFLQNDMLYDPYEIEQKLPEHYRGQQFLLEGDYNIEDWKNMDYRTNPMPFTEVHYTSKGVKCRSKSEALIGIRLEERNIDYQYDTELELKGEKKYPDFKILLPNRRRIVYLEHFGMIDNPGYAVNSFRKMETYEKNGIYLGINFFYTFETKQLPLNMKMIDRKIDEIMRLDKI